MNFKKGMIPKKLDGFQLTPYDKDNYVISNSVLGYYVKIDKNTFNLLHLVDGKKNLQTIAEEFWLRYNISITPQFVYVLLYEKLHLYQGDNKETKNRFKPESYIKLRFPILKTRFLEKIVPFFYPMFKKKIALSMLTICFIVLVFVGWFYIDIYQRFELHKSIFLFIISMLGSVVLHEIGHITAASYYGAKHGAIGVGLYLFIPVFYADVTDIWSLSKPQRIIVNMSGVYFELVYITFVCLLGVLLKIPALVIAALMIMINTLYNLIPFFRADGYWLLCDFFSTPHIMQNALQRIKTPITKNGWSEIKKWKKTDYLFFFYGIFAYALTVVFIFYTLFFRAHSLVYFPIDLFNFLQSIFSQNLETSLQQIFLLLPPIIFYILLFKWLKKIAQRIKISKIKKCLVLK